MKVLRARIFEAERQRQVRALSSQRQGLIGSGDRSERIRTYNFPQVLFPFTARPCLTGTRKRNWIVYACGAILKTCFGRTPFP